MLDMNLASHIHDLRMTSELARFVGDEAGRLPDGALPDAVMIRRITWVIKRATNAATSALLALEAAAPVSVEDKAAMKVAVVELRVQYARLHQIALSVLEKNAS